MNDRFSFPPYNGSKTYGVLLCTPYDVVYTEPYIRNVTNHNIHIWYGFEDNSSKTEAVFSEKILDSSYVIVMVSTSFFQSSFYKRMLRTAIEFDKPVFPVFLENVQQYQIEPRDSVLLTNIKNYQGVSDLHKMDIPSITNELMNLIGTVDSEKKNKSEKFYLIYAYKYLTNHAKGIIIIGTLVIISLCAIVVFSRTSYFISNYNVRERFPSLYEKESSSPYDDWASPISMKNIHSIEDIKNNRALAHRKQAILFGSYEQDGILTNGKEAIEWVVIDVEDDTALLISKMILDYKPFNSFEYVTWETCSLRNWLASDFYSSAFASEEKEQIIEIENINPSTDLYDKKTYGGKNTFDKVFLLSEGELENYFIDNSSRISIATTYAAQMYEKNNDDEFEVTKINNWWSRSPGRENRFFIRVDTDGRKDKYGMPVSCSYGVRPAIWVKI